MLSSKISILSLFLFSNLALAQGVYQPSNTPLKQFGFSTGPEEVTAADFTRYYDTARRILGDGAIIRTGLTWDPVNQNVPGFERWSANVLEPAIPRKIKLIPSVRTIDVTAGGYRMPTDAQWEAGLRAVVKMYGPGGIYQRGGSYRMNDRVITVAPHPNFEGIVDYELWNEPNTEGNLGGAMSPARISQLMKIASRVMREEAATLGFRINILGPPIGSLDVSYLEDLYAADRNFFTYMDTMIFHDYMKVPPSKCTPTGVNRRRCTRTYDVIREFLNTHGGAHLHIGTTEGGYAGSNDKCRSPNVGSEQQQADYTEESLRWIHDRPYLNFDFKLTYHAIDTTRPYAHACGSTELDIDYWEERLGAVRADLKLKAYGTRLKMLRDLWK